MFRRKAVKEYRFCSRDIKQPLYPAGFGGDFTAIEYDIR
jgi:hypothetical protein